MADYIDRDAVYHAISVDVGLNAYEKAYCIDIVRKIPAADVAPVRHGRWDDSGRYRFENGDLAIRCTGCGCSLHEDEFEKFVWNYCPVCGARMDGGDKNDE